MKPGAIFTIGSRRGRDPAGIVDLLQDCHGRIRQFSGLAHRLAHARDVGADEIADAAHRVRRYFEEALPLHVQDEEDSVLLRLEGMSPALDDALAQMHGEHDDHVPIVADLIEVCRAVERTGELDRQRERLRAITAALVPAFHEHLAHEEEVIFPAIAQLVTGDPIVEQEMLAELRQRRAATPPAG